jgi:hypothetical protein
MRGAGRIVAMAMAIRLGGPRVWPPFGRMLSSSRVGATALLRRRAHSAGGRGDTFTTKRYLLVAISLARSPITRPAGLGAFLFTRQSAALLGRPRRLAARDNRAKPTSVCARVRASSTPTVSCERPAREGTTTRLRGNHPTGWPGPARPCRYRAPFFALALQRAEQTHRAGAGRKPHAGPSKGLPGRVQKAQRCRRRARPPLFSRLAVAICHERRDG